MTSKKDTYTYRGGRKLALRKSDTEFVVRATPETLAKAGLSAAAQLSPRSSKVTTSEDQLDRLMEQASKVATTHGAYAEAVTGNDFLITDRILVTFRDALASADVDAFAGKYALVQRQKYGERDYLFQLTEHTGRDGVELVVELTENEPQVEIAENDLNYRMQGSQPLALPSDPSYPEQWHLHRRSQSPEFDPRSSARCEEAWQILDSFGSFDVVVGLTDDGCRLDHPDFNSPGKFAGWGYFVGERLVVREDIDAQPAQMYQTGADHGTACAGVAAGEADAVLTVGGAPGCRLLPIKWESDKGFFSIGDSKLLTALNYLANKVDVVSNSWGSSPTSLFATTVVNRVRELSSSGGRRGRGIVFLWAAGNQNCPIEHPATPVDVPYDTGWRANADGTQTWIGVKRATEFIHPLAALSGVMYVAAVSSVAKRSHYSNYGTGISICAPSSNRHQYKRLTVPGLGITTTTGKPEGVRPDFGGTSSATPLTAAVAALTISANPRLTAAQVISILKRTASKDLSFEGYGKTPPASYDPDTSWDVSPIAPFDRGEFTDVGSPEGTWSPWFGHGRVDAAAAVAEARRLAAGDGSQTFRQSSVPVLQIPDNVATGVRDTIRFADNATAGSVKVSVDITHTYIGDLRLVLTAPSGSAVVLHDRSGGRTQNIRTVFDSTNTPGLTALTGQSIQGNWTLLVQDLAAVDTGLLNRWEIEVVGFRSSAIRVEEAPGLTIPDNDTRGIERQLNVAGEGRIADIAVDLDITHTYIGDLSVALISPMGTRIPLHERAGKDADNIIRAYTAATTPALAALRGQPVQGAWRLLVADLDARDVGKLNRWGVRIERGA